MIKFFKILFYIAAAIVVLIGGVYLYLFQAGGLESIVSKKIQDLVSDKYGLNISIGNIGGDIVSGVVIKDVRVNFSDSLGQIELLVIPKLLARYSLRGLLSGDYDFELIEIDSARIRLVESDSGKWRIPSFASDKPGGGGSGSSAAYGLISKLQINNAIVVIEKRSDTLIFSEINLAASLMAQGNTYAANLSRLSLNSSREDYKLEYCSGKLTFANGLLSFQELSVGKGESRLRLSGTVDTRGFTAQFSFAADNLDIAEISAYAGLNLKGKIDLNGTFDIGNSGMKASLDLAGTFQIAEFKNIHIDMRYSEGIVNLDTVYGTIFDHCSVDGSGNLDLTGEVEKYTIVAAIRGFNLKSLVKNGFESDLSGDIRLSGSSFKNRDLRLDIDAALYESSFNGYQLHSAIGSMVITTDSIEFLEPFAIKYFENEFRFNGMINYKDSLNIELTAQLQNLERYHDKLFIKRPAGRGFLTARVSGKTSDPDLWANFKSDSVWIYDLYSERFSATVNIKSFLKSKQGDIEVFTYSGSAWDVPVNKGYSFLKIDSNIVTIDSVYLENNYSSVHTSGVLDYESVPMSLELKALELQLFNQQFLNRGSINIDIDSLGFYFRQAAIANDEMLLSATGSISYVESMDIDFFFDELQISPWMKLAFEEDLLSGEASGRASMKGTFKQPIFDLNLTVDSLVFKGVHLGNLATDAQYGDELLAIDSIVLVSEQGRYFISGVVPINLSFSGATVKRLLDKPMHLSILATDKKFDLLTAMLPDIEQLEGDFVTDFKVFGTPNNPHLEGMAYIRQARLKYFDLEEYIYSDSVGVTMVDNRIVLDSIEAYAYRGNKKNSPKRYAELEGEIIVKALDNLYYDIYLTLPREFPFNYELADIRGSIEGEMHIQGDTPPIVTGDLALVAMRYAVNFAEPDEGSPIMMAFSEEGSWGLNLNIDILSNYWVKNDDIDAQFSGFINIIRENGREKLIGELEVVRGRGFLFDKIFRLEPGGTVIFDGGDSLNPRLNLVAYTRITSYTPSTFEGDQTSIQKILGIRISGTLDHPDISVTDDSEVSEDELLPALAGTEYGEGDISSFGSFGQRVSSVVATQVSKIGSKQFRQLGLETFEVDPSYYRGDLDLARTRFTLGFSPFDPNLYVYGKSALGSTTGQEIGFEYRRFKSFILEGRRDEEELYHLNLKLHWEF
ncbi:MAG: translocation/assembly module TamB domain-containing protein [candidate division Zixibacteria bacterium]|nr:translocation/assembly module TamB domain-containing protein [candidate division Zixibacteria bacterium]